MNDDHQDHRSFQNAPLGHAPDTMQERTKSGRHLPLRILTLAVAVAILASAFFAVGFIGDSDAAGDASGSCGSGLTYTYTASTKTLEITFTGSGTDTGAMTDYSQGGAPWYSYRNDIQTLTIGNGVTSIGYFAFYLCSGFTGALTIPNSVTSIGYYAFYGCSNLTGNLTIPDSVTSIGNSAFNGCSGFTGTLTLPTNASFTSIGIGAFFGCSSFTGNLTIPDSVTSIGNSAFEGCLGFTGSLTIPDSVTSIGDYAFCECFSLTGSLTIPDSVTSIGDYAFHGCSSLTGSLTIPDSVTSIGGAAFEECSGFTGSLTIPDSVTSIGTYTFFGCSGFTGSLTIPDSVTSIGGAAFRGCSGFDGNLTIPDSVTSIGIGAFRECSGFDGNLTISGSVTSIGTDAFSGCSGFTGSLTIPDSVTSIGDYAFYQCSGFTGALTIPDSVTSIDIGAFQECLGFDGELSLPTNASFTSIYPFVFRGCSNLTGALTIPDSVTSIGTDAFQECSGFTSIILPNNNCTVTVSSAFNGLSFYPDGVILSSPSWDQVKNKTWYGDGDGKFYNGTLTVTLDANGGTVSSDSMTVTYGGQYGAFPDAQPQAYLVGWFTESSGGTQILPTTDVMPVDSQTLYAHWSNYVKVTFYGNGSDAGSMVPQYIGATDPNQNLAANGFSKTGSTFQNWNTVAAGTGMTYTDQQDVGSIITAPHVALDLYAQWTPEEYSVTANISGGSIEETTVSYHVEAQIAITAADGHSLPVSVTMKMGADDFTEFTYVDGIITIDDGIITGPLTITATCPEWQLTVTFDGNGGTPTGMKKTTGSDGKLTGFPDDPERDGYTFGGWYTSISEGTEITLSTVFDADTTVYAHWTETPGPVPPGPSPRPTPPVIKVTVTFDASAGGSVSPDKVNVPLNSKISVNGPAMFFSSGSSVTRVLAVPDTGYAVDSWSVTEGNVLEDMTILVTFKKVSLSEISVWKKPYNLSYLEGERFDPTGLTIALNYSDGSMGFLDYRGNESKFSFSPSTDTPLKTSDKSVTITYEGKFTTQDITVKGSSGSDDTVIYVAVAAIAAVLIVGAAILLLRKRAV